MNVNRYLMGSIAVFIYLFVIEFVFHGVLLAEWYQESRHLLRPEEAASTYFVWMILGFLILAFGFCYIFIIGYKGNGILEGLRYGLYVGIAFSISSNLINYAVFPYPGKWVLAWSIGYPIIFILAGILVEAVYRQRTAQQ